MIWFLLMISIVTEVFATSMLNASQGFSRPLYGVAALALYAVSLGVLAKVMTGLPVGIVYAVWSGMGVVLISAIGWFFFKQKLDLPAFVGLAMIIGGVLVINLFSHSSVH
ncbi:DMT family transporter [Testudinibacter sp. TR-2022]|uniref:DMT family transporter n=1 Tax=Testudinibacter sp. TR-2022 TaxID=2585029 RepID=UPI00111B51DE|nr:SMR family transporter [Testudinibacter sp. TR-2022]TNH06998.1 QacE family quaternary ammonium compound efflux SMR transporter [Pasteurellaceae bacterium Phil11]TNH22863.1 QacE family quaternary ammonium compound efflux SMR transporter [Testudinibacter sp. TR-2022]TNH25287.1 QacE family quaternary ammonium compound efflux SMR transporter [Testudinibacter sp. TR-2022]